MLNEVIRYFDLQSQARGAAQLQASNGVRPPVFLQYIACVLGVVAQPYLSAYTASSGFGVTTFNAFLFRVIFGLLIGLAILPAIYKKAFDDAQPTFVQLCALFVSGIGWQSLFSIGAK